MLKNWKPNSAERAVLEGRCCGYCQSHTVHFGTRVECPQCKAAVSCDTHGKPLGRVATPYLRYLRSQAHKAFDRIWRSGGMTRPEAYTWLADELGLPKEFTHIGMMGEVTCQRTIATSDAYIKSNISGSYSNQP